MKFLSFINIKRIQYFILFASFLTTGLNAQVVNIPDINFKNYLLSHYDDNSDGQIQLSEAQSGPSLINVSGMNISDLTGIGAFSNITSLHCYDNQLTSLNLSGNIELEYLYCSQNSLTSLTLPLSSTLSTVYCSFNLLTSLNTNGSTGLTNLSCGNNQLTSLNLSANSLLSILDCNDNQITNLNLSANWGLTELNCAYNPISNLDVSSNINLTYLAGDHMLLTSLNVSMNTALETLYCYSNQITSLDVSANTALELLYASDNELNSLNVSTNLSLKHLTCSFNQISHLNVSSNSVLNELFCQSNQLVSLNVKNGNNLNFLNFYAANNPGLYCIQVDDSTYSATTWTHIDPWVNFGSVCQTKISGTVFDAEVNFATGQLDYNLCDGCFVELYQGSSLIDSQTVSSSGQFNFVNLTGANYKVVASRTLGSVTSKVINDFIDPGDSLGKIIIPSSLIAQANLIVDSLDSRLFTTNMFYNLNTLNVTADGYNEGCIENYLLNSHNIQSNNENIVNSLARLYVAQFALKEFSNDASIMITETVVSGFDLGISIYNIATISKKIDQVATNYSIVLKKLKKYALGLALRTIKFVVVQAINCVSDNSIRTQTKSKFEGLMDVLIDHADADDANDFSESVATQFVRDHMTAQLTPYIYERVFVSETNYNVNETCLNSTANNFTGEFSEAYNSVIHNVNNNSIIDTAHARTTLKKNKIENLRTISAFSAQAARLASIAALATTSFDGGTMISLSGILSGLSVGSTASAFGTGIYRTAELKEELSNVTLNSFLRTNVSGQFYSRDFLSSRTLDLSSATSDYNLYLQGILSNIDNGQRSLAISKLDSLIVLDSLLEEAQLNSLAPINAAAPYAISVIAEFDSLYNNTVINSAGESMFERQAIVYNLIGYLLDSTSTDIIDSLNLSVVNAINFNGQVISDIANMNDSIISILIPAHLVVTSSQIPKPMLPGTIYPISFSYLNIGAIDAIDVYAQLNVMDGFTTGMDSIFIGSVPVGGAGLVTFNIMSPPYDTITYLTMSFKSPNTTSDGLGTSLVVKNMISVEENETEASSISIYPNPFTNEAIIEFTEEQKNGSVRIIDALGKEMSRSYFSGKSVVIRKDMLKPGIYFIQVTDSAQNLINKKIVIL